MEQERERLLEAERTALTALTVDVDNYFSTKRPTVPDLSVALASEMYQQTGRLPGDRGTYCEFVANGDKYIADGSGKFQDSGVVHLRLLLSNLLGQVSEEELIDISHGHSFAFATGKSGQGYIIDNTFQQFFTPDGKVIADSKGSVNTRLQDVLQNPHLTSLIRDGYLPLTSENLKEYLLAMTSDDYAAAVASKLDQLEHPQEFIRANYDQELDYTTEELAAQFSKRKRASRRLLGMLRRLFN
jgi:hypothetical protein